MNEKRKIKVVLNEVFFFRNYITKIENKLYK